MEKKNHEYGEPHANLVPPLSLTCLTSVFRKVYSPLAIQECIKFREDDICFLPWEDAQVCTLLLFLTFRFSVD